MSTGAAGSALVAHPTAADRPPLWLFSATNLVIGTGAFALASVLGSISADLGVSIATAGQVTTAYALATAVLAPLMLVATSRLVGKRAMAFALTLFTLGSLICAAAPNFGVLLAGRVLMGAGAMFTPLAAGMAVAASPPAQRGRALSIVFLGISFSYVVGLPLGNSLAALYGWRAPVLVVASCCVVAMGVLMWRVPATLNGPPVRFAGLGLVLRQREVAQVLGLTLLYFTSIFNVFAYIGPVLQALVPQSPARASATLLCFGLSGVLGTLVGGWASDKFGPIRTLRWQLVAFIAAQCALPLTQGHHAALLLVLAAWGTAGFGMMPAQQIRLANASPANAPLLMSLNASMLYVGTAAGAVLGAAASQYLGFAHLAWAGVPLVVLGWATVWLPAGAVR